MGKPGSPPSNSTQTLASLGGTAKKPTPGPANGAQGIAQFRWPSPSTLGTLTWTRPWRYGSLLSVTLPRYLPKNSLLGAACVGTGLVLPTLADELPPGYTTGLRAPVPSRVRVKLCLYSPLRILWVTLLT